MGRLITLKKQCETGKYSPKDTCTSSHRRMSTRTANISPIPKPRLRRENSRSTFA